MEPRRSQSVFAAHARSELLGRARVKRRGVLVALGGGAIALGCQGGYTSLGSNEERDAAPVEAGTLDASMSSGLPWLSGTNASDVARVDAWAAYRGRANDVALILTDYTSWDGVTRPDARLDAFQNFRGDLVIGQPLWPSNSGGSTKACAAGDYDAHWRDFGATLVAHDRARSIVRLAWQFNGDYVEWSASDPTTWTSCFQRVVSAIRANDPAARIDWSMNAHGTQAPAGGDAFDVYPGDAFVDIVGIDAYDMTPSSPDEAAFMAQCSGQDGICTVADFARRHGKQLGVGQWAVVTCNGFGDRGGDNPFYIQRMHQVFVENADIMGYETYYNDPQPSEFCTSLLDPTDAPLSSQRYRELWGP
jgi:hypothetical protein